MPNDIKKYLIGNWKMNGLGADFAYCADLIERTSGLSGIKFGVCPPATLIGRFVDAFTDSHISVGGQDCHSQKAGAYTGDISAQMIADLGATMVLIGHSERRREHHETSAQVARKTLSAQEAGLTAILCVGEVLDKRESDEAVSFVVNQLSRSLPVGELDPTRLIVAYEPVWAIGSGLTPSLADIEEMHTAIRAALAKRFTPEDAADIPILYGGSLNAAKADILTVPNVDGGLIGGASLIVDSFASIAEGYLKLG